MFLTTHINSNQRQRFSRAISMEYAAMACSEVAHGLVIPGFLTQIICGPSKDYAKVH